jgi:hypothetical protein
VATESPRRRKAAAPEKRRYVKATVTVDVRTHALWSAAAALRGMDRSAFAVEALTSALKGLVLVDRRGGPDGDSDPVVEDRQSGRVA